MSKEDGKPMFPLEDFKIEGPGGVVGVTYRGRTQRTEYSGHKFRGLLPGADSLVGIYDYGFFKPGQIEAIGVVVGEKKSGRDREYDVWVCAADPLEWKFNGITCDLKERSEDDIIPIGLKTGIPGQCVVFFLRQRRGKVRRKVRHGKRRDSRTCD